MSRDYSHSPIRDDKSQANFKSLLEDNNPWMNKNQLFAGRNEDEETSVNANNAFTCSEFKMTRSNRSVGSNRSHLDNEYS